MTEQTPSPGISPEERQEIVDELKEEVKKHLDKLKNFSDDDTVLLNYKLHPDIKQKENVGELREFFANFNPEDKSQLQRLNQFDELGLDGFERV